MSTVLVSSASPALRTTMGAHSLLDSSIHLRHCSSHQTLRLSFVRCLVRHNTPTLLGCLLACITILNDYDVTLFNTPSPPQQGRHNHHFSPVTGRDTRPRLLCWVPTCTNLNVCGVGSDSELKIVQYIFPTATRALTT